MFLREAKVGIPINGNGCINHSIDRFLEDIKKFQFNITKNTLGDLLKFKKDLESKEDNYTLTENDANTLHNIMYKLESTFEAESSSIWTFALREKRFPISVLLGDIKQLFGKGVFNKLPELSRFDLTEAGKCIATERYTASAFHILRAMEEIIKDLYLSVIKQKRLKKPMWFGMVESLKKKTRKKPNEALLDQLDSIRKHYRNPTAHPTKVYDCDEAQDLLATSIATINMMVKEKKRYV